MTELDWTWFIFVFVVYEVVIFYIAYGLTESLTERIVRKRNGKRRNV